MANFDIVYLSIRLLALVIAIAVHESAHAWMAYILGDSTARAQGRISLNPFAHLDLFGTIILPLLMLLSGGPLIAFAKPVPVYIQHLRKPRRDAALVSLAGPISNIVLAVLCACALRLFLGVATYTMDYTIDFLLACIGVNLSLAMFNLLPIPPLDGSQVVLSLLSDNVAARYRQFQQYAMPFFIIVVYLLPKITGIDLLGIYLSATINPIFDLLLRFPI